MNDISYFYESCVWKYLFEGFKEKYESYGKFSGNIKLKDLTLEEISVLEGFFMKNFHGRKVIVIEAKSFEKALSQSKFKDIKPKELLEMYFNTTLEKKSDVVEKERKINEAKINKLMVEYEGTPAIKWLEKNTYNDNTELFIKIINNFPIWSNKTVYLPVFAAQITGDPHAFDNGNCLDVLTKFYFKENEPEYSQAFERKKCYLKAGILIDDVSNNAMVFGIRATVNGRWHKGIEGFYEEHSLLNIPLNTINELEEIHCNDNKLYIVENPSVYSMLYEKYKDSISCMCMYGQPKISSLLLLSKLKKGTDIYYACDYDPEGLTIAQNIFNYYKGNSYLWEMSVENYHLSLSDKIVSHERIKKLRKITDSDLLLISEEMANIRKAGYQENVDLPTPIK